MGKVPADSSKGFWKELPKSFWTNVVVLANIVVSRGVYPEQMPV